MTVKECDIPDNGFLVVTVLKVRRATTVFGPRSCCSWSTLTALALWYSTAQGADYLELPLLHSVTMGWPHRQQGAAAVAAESWKQWPRRKSLRYVETCNLVLIHIFRVIHSYRATTLQSGREVVPRSTNC